MSPKVKRKARPGKRRGYGIWSLGIVLAIAMVAIGISAVRSSRTESYPAPTPSALPAESYPTPAPSAFLPEITRISAAAVKAKLDKKTNIVIVDARAREAYQQTRIAGAISIPLEDISRRHGELRRYDEIITYCGCPDEETSARAAQILMGVGLKSKPIEGGLMAWEEAGYPLEGIALQK